MGQDKNSNNIYCTFNNSQINISTDNGTVNAVQANIPKTGEWSNSDNGMAIIIGCALIIMTAMGFYVQYRWLVLIGFIVTSSLIAILTCSIYYIDRKNKFLYNRDLSQIVFFNILSDCLILISIIFICSPFYNRENDFAFLNQQILTDGSISAYFTNPLAQYALCQMMGLFFVGLLLIHIMLSDLYVIADINVMAKKKGDKFWKLLSKLTYNKLRTGKKHIVLGIILLFAGLIFISGLFAYVVDISHF